MSTDTINPSMIRVAPVDGRSVRDPATGRTVEEAIDVEEDTFWRRRLDDGDVVEAPAVQSKEKAK